MTEVTRMHTKKMASRRIALMYLFAGQQWRGRQREETYLHAGRSREQEGEAGMNGENSMEIHPPAYVK